MEMDMQIFQRRTGWREGEQGEFAPPPSPIPPHPIHPTFPH